MIDDQLLELLESSNAETRKQAVKRLAQTKNRDALPYLADVYRNDDDPEVRDLARKGGIYIKRNAPEESPAESLYEEDDYATEEVAPDSAPLPSEIYVSPAQQEKAQSLVQQALDVHMRGDNEKAAQLLNRALRANPHLMHDGYTTSLAATVTGMSGPQAIQMLAPTNSELKKRKDTPPGSKSSNRPGGLQAALAFMTMLAAVVVLVGFLLFPWIDMSSIPTEDGNTLGASFDEMRSQLDQEDAEQAFIIMMGEEDGRAMYDALKAMTVQISGLDTALVSVGLRDIIDVMGLRQLFDLMLGEFASGEVADTTTQVQPDALDYTLLFVPVGGLLALGLAIYLLTRTSLINWAILIGVGLLTIGPYIYFYTSMIEDVVPTDTDLGVASTVVDISGASLIGMGFWVSLVGALMLVILPFVAVIATPSAETAPAAERLE